MPSTKNSRRNGEATSQHDANGIQLAETLLQHATVLRKRVNNSRRIHPELADPQVLAFWIKAFQNVAENWADELEERADQLIKEHGSG